MKKYLIGIDEAGRGPLAGPVAVGVVVAPYTFDLRLLKGVRDSKRMEELGREIWYEKLRVLEVEYGVRHLVQFSSAHYIDTYGIVPAVRAAIARALRLLEVDPRVSHVLLDGALKAPSRFISQETIIRGDETEPLISLASIAAKVRRDRLMRMLAVRHPEYGFEIHKGYGTKMHREALIKHGLSVVHRKSFCGIDVN
ncbi:MAG: ribonuclease HII [Parcubacteria group bacterium Gr01-1014_56]|nr:MAG: ribonuclease HII [Parcubacteria group bacterium Gr01-1014_56]